MTDPRLTKYAYVMIHYSLALKKGEYLMLKGYPCAKPLLVELYKEALKVGASPEIVISVEEAEEFFFNTATDDQLDYLSPFETMMNTGFDAAIHILGNDNTRMLANTDSEKMAQRGKAIGKLDSARIKRASQGKFRWVWTQYPSHGDALEAGLSTTDFEDFTFEAGMITAPDPITEWKKQSVFQEKICQYLNKKSSLHYLGEGIDFKINIKNRTWCNYDGHSNFPDGEIFCGPVEDSAEGFIHFNLTAIKMGREIDGIKLVFEKGKVVKATAAKGEEFLNKILDTDPGARRIGELAFGTNYNIKKYTRNILFDEKIGGTIHIALGHCPPEANGNNPSGLHWDIITGMTSRSEIFADGELFYKNGEFLKDVIGLN